MKAHAVAGEVAVDDVAPADPGAQHAGVPAGEGAALHPHPGHSGQSGARAGAQEGDVIQIGDPIDGPGLQLEGGGKGGALLPLGAAVEVEGPGGGDGDGLIGHRRQVEIDLRVGLQGVGQLVQQGLELRRGGHGGVRGVVVIGAGGGDGHLLPQADGVPVLHGKGPGHLGRTVGADGVVHQADQRDAGKGAVGGRSGAGEIPAAPRHGGELGGDSLHLLQEGRSPCPAVDVQQDGSAVGLPGDGGGDLPAGEGLRMLR